MKGYLCEPHKQQLDLSQIEARLACARRYQGVAHHIHREKPFVCLLALALLRPSTPYRQAIGTESKSYITRTSASVYITQD